MLPPGTGPWWDGGRRVGAGGGEVDGGEVDSGEVEGGEVEGGLAGAEGAGTWVVADVGFTAPWRADLRARRSAGDDEAEGEAAEVTHPALPLGAAASLQVRTGCSSRR
ncbi:MAG: hypothetical protein WAV00_06525 [Nocardioides sp.]